MKSTKPTVGFYSITGCAGCLLSFIFNEKEIVQMTKLVTIVSFPFIHESAEIKEVDVAFMEGLVASPEDEEVLKEVRKKAKTLVALGACAHTACIPGYRHFVPKDSYARLMYEKLHKIKTIEPGPIDKYVQVDFTIPGCPPNKREIIESVVNLCLKKQLKNYTSPVCVECRRNNNRCLLEENRICLGPITRGGCNAICTNSHFECWGCRGPTDDMNLPAFIELLEGKGFTKRDIRERIIAFSGQKNPKVLEVLP